MLLPMILYVGTEPQADSRAYTREKQSASYRVVFVRIVQKWDDGREKERQEVRDKVASACRKMSNGVVRGRGGARN